MPLNRKGTEPTENPAPLQRGNKIETQRGALEDGETSQSIIHHRFRPVFVVVEQKPRSVYDTVREYMEKVWRKSRIMMVEKRRGHIHR